MQVVNITGAQIKALANVLDTTPEDKRTNLVQGMAHHPQNKGYRIEDTNLSNAIALVIDRGTYNYNFIISIHGDVTDLGRSDNVMTFRNRK